VNCQQQQHVQISIHLTQYERPSSHPSIHNHNGNSHYIGSLGCLCFRASLLVAQRADIDINHTICIESEREQQYNKICASVAAAGRHQPSEMLCAYRLRQSSSHSLRPGRGSNSTRYVYACIKPNVVCMYAYTGIHTSRCKRKGISS
jgi:hypothetical protein